VIVFETSEHIGDRLPKRFRLIIMLGSFALLAMVQLSLLQHDYVALEALRQWADVMMVWQAEEVARNTMVLLFPPIPYGVLVALHAIPLLGGPSTPYLLDNVAVAAVVGTLAGSVYRRSQSIPWSLLLGALVLFNPLVVWIATSGEGHGVLFGAYYLLSAAILRLKLVPDVRTQIGLSAALVFLALCDIRFLFIVVALIPMIAVMGEPGTIEKSAGAYYFVALFAPVAVLLSHAYLNWIFLDDPLAFIRHVDAPFRGAAAMGSQFSWLRDYGGSLLKPMIVALGFTAVCAPLALFVLPPLMLARRLAFSALVISIAIPMIALGLATATSYSPHPAPFVALVIAPTIQSAVLVLERWGRRVIVATFLAVGALGGWTLMTWRPTEQMARWRTALVRPVPITSATELALGRWLQTNQEETLLDDRHAFPAIIARGSARGLLLPPSEDFKMAVVTGRPEATQIAVPEPSSAAARGDRLARALPTLFEHGRPGYVLAYDGPGWRVYRSSRPHANAKLSLVKLGSGR